MRIDLEVFLLIAVLGCGSSAPAPTGVGNAVPAKPDVRRSSDAMVREVVALLAAGDAGGLVALADFEEPLLRATGCTGVYGEQMSETLRREKRKLHDKIAAAAARSKGLALEVVEIESGGVNDLVKAGRRVGECVQKADATQQRVAVRMRAEGQVSTMKLDLINIDKRLFIFNLSRNLGRPIGDEVMAKFEAQVDAVCACADAACITAAIEAGGKERAEWAKANADLLGEAPSEEHVKATERAMQRMTDCAARIANQQRP